MPEEQKLPKSYAHCLMLSRAHLGNTCYYRV